MPLVVQYNKRDLPGVLSVPMLQHWLTIPDEVPQFEACARRGDGVSSTLKAPVKQCLKLMGNPRAVSSVRVPCIMPTRRPRIFPTRTPNRAFAFLPQRLTA